MDSRVVAKFGENWTLGTCRKVILFTAQKNPVVRDSPEPQILPHLADRAQHFLNVIASGPVNVYQICSGSNRLKSAGVIPRRFILQTLKVIKC